LNELEERLELINMLKRKYGESIAEVLATRERAARQLEQITHSKERAAELQAQEEDLLRRIGKSGQALSDKRKETARTLSTAVERQLNDLQMAGARFEVQFEREPAADGAYVEDQRFAFDQTGLDRAEFLISANPGEPLKPVAKVASGGETARLMLALKTALAEVDGTPTLIFDEIDQGIGGRVGGVVGRKLWGLTTVGDHQVVVVTHLPQLAGYGDVHFHVSKQVIDERTTTAVKNLDRSGRVAELAAMLGTGSDTAVGGAESILRQVHDSKKSQVSSP
jgi:DNA repair protein RecN (Recombination protein N)